MTNRWTQEQYNEYIRRQNGSQGKRQAPKLERPAINEPLAENQAQKRDSRKCQVSVVSVRKRLIDTDNLSPKYHVDALRYSGCLHVDSADKTTITAAQIKCQKGQEEHVIISIEYL